MDLNFLENKAKELRRDILRVVSSAKSSHIGSMLSIIEILTYLFYEKMDFNKSNYKNKDRDKFILSKGHASLALYSILSDKEIINKSQLETYCKNGGKLIGHLDHNVEGVEISTGSLGHGLSIATGIALANKLDKLDNKVYCLIGDGECNEGSIWEALIFIANNNLKNLVIFIDANKLQGYDFCDKILPENRLINLLKNLDLNFYEINGHNFSDLQKTFEKISNSNNSKASIVFAHTTKGKGVSFMENKLEWHYKSPNLEELENALEELK